MKTSGENNGKLTAYQKELFDQTHPYQKWWRQKEALSPAGNSHIVGNAGAQQPHEAGRKAPEFVVFAHRGGRLSRKALDTISDYFNLYPACEILYADEDVWLTEDNRQQVQVSSDGEADAEGMRVCNPWLKPDWSPDTFRSFFYFGNLFAVRKCVGTDALLEKMQRAPEGTAASGPLCDKGAGAEGAGEVERESGGRLTFFGEEQRETLWDRLGEYIFRMGTGPEQKIKIRHLPEILYHYGGTDGWEEKIRFPRYPENLREGVTVSVIIPSRDHPKLLAQCLESVRCSIGAPATSLEALAGQGGGETAHVLYEVIVVDNGSGDGEKAEILRLKEIYGFRYLYVPMEFNFSRMCNLGAREAKGMVLLFLNDDITVPQTGRAGKESSRQQAGESCAPAAVRETEPESTAAEGADWLEILAEQALQPWCGAVGARLYYPESRRLQHVGITNMKVGPAHKLGGMTEDGRENLYHNRNRAVNNAIAVTAAALAVEQTKFREMRGFFEGLAVAYNDVDLCFSLYENDYYNVVRNDVVFYHHESASRGEDTSSEKARRLLLERQKLYERHPALSGMDPFYHRDLVQYRLDADYHIEVTYDHEDYGKCSECMVLRDKVEDTASVFRKLLHKGPELMLSIDSVRRELRLDGAADKEAEFVVIEGWGSPAELPGYGFERRLILLGRENYLLSVFPKYRPDTAAVLAAQPYYELSGFVARVPGGQIAHGTYRLGMQFTDGRGKRRVVLDQEEYEL